LYGPEWTHATNEGERSEKNDRGIKLLTFAFEKKWLVTYAFEKMVVL